MSDNVMIPGLVVGEDFNSTGVLTVPEGTVAVFLVPNLEDGTYRAGSITRTPTGKYDAKSMDFMYTLGLGLLIMATDKAEEALEVAFDKNNYEGFAAVTNDGEVLRKGVEIVEPVPPITTEAELAACDTSKLHKA